MTEKGRPKQENFAIAWADKSMFTLTLGEVFKECKGCPIGGDGHICIVEMCPSEGLVSKKKYEQWKKEKNQWDDGLMAAIEKDKEAQNE